MGQGKTLGIIYWKDYQSYNIGSLKKLGGTQIVSAMICGILCIVGATMVGNQKCEHLQMCGDSEYYSAANLSISSQNESESKEQNNYSVNPFLELDITCLILSGLFLLAGFLPFCMTKNEQSSLLLLKDIYTVLCFVGALFSIPIVLILMKSGTLYEHSLGVVAALITLTCLVQIVFAIVGVLVCCCCLSYGINSDKRTIYTDKESSESNNETKLPFKTNLCRF